MLGKCDVGPGRRRNKSSLEPPLPMPDSVPMGVREEVRALSAVVDRLAERHPGVARHVIEEVVQEEHRSLDRGRVRDFVPILGGHAARDRLHTLSR